MVTTAKIKLTNYKFFEILISTYLKKKWWLMAWIWTLILILLLDRNKDSIELFLVLFLILFQIILVIQYRRYAYSNENKVFLLERYYEIDNDMINGKMEDGTSQPIKIEHFIKVIKTSKYYLLYLAKSQFIYLPVDAFSNHNDLEWFENEIIKKIKK
jgi:hypothetical protein